MKRPGAVAEQMERKKRGKERKSDGGGETESREVNVSTVV